MIRTLNLKARIALSVSITIFGLCASGTGQIIPGEGMDSGLGGQNIIAGSILAGSGERVMRRVQIRLSTAMSGDRTIMSDEKGNFVIRNVPNGNYTIVIDKEKDFEPFRQPVDVMQFRGSPPQTYTLSIRLTPKRVDSPKPAVISAELVGVPKPALEFYAKGLELAGTGDRKGAVEQFKLAIAEHPKFVLAYNEMGVQYLRSNESDLAVTAFGDALKIDPESFPPLINLGMVLVEIKQYAEAEPILRSVIKIDSNSQVAHYFLGQSLANQGKFDEAESALRVAVKGDDPKMKEAHRILAIIYNSRGEKNKFASELEAYLRLAPNAPDAAQLKQMIVQARGSEPANRKP